MGFMTQIIAYLNSGAEWLLTAYYRVRDWIPPFSYLATPLYYIYRAFYNLAYYFGKFNDWLSWATNKIASILDITTITYYFQSWLTKAQAAFDWIVNALSNVLNIVEAWWSKRQQVILTWIEQAKLWALAKVNELSIALSSLLTWWNSFISKLPSLEEILLWFRNWWENVLRNLNSWWVEKLFDVKSLLNSLLLELMPFWEGWQEIREIVYNFFDNPLDWLWAKFTDWFLGKE